MHSILDIIDSFDGMNIATEELSDVSMFFKDPSQFLDIEYRENKASNPDILYTADLDTGGKVFTSVVKACTELVKVNAYQEALLILSQTIDKMKMLREDNLGKDDNENLDWSINELKTMVLKTSQARDEYTSKRKSVLAKYSLLYK